MKTALVTTCWLGTEGYIQRLNKWLAYYIGPISQDLKYDDIIILDNASPFEELAKIQAAFPNVKINRFYRHYSRPEFYNYMYLWRAVDFYAELFNTYDKVIYMDNDFYILSERFVNHINNLASEWHSPWCNKHKFPETGLQIIHKNAATYRISRPFSRFNGQCMEHVLPVEVDKAWVGDRHSEDSLLIQQPSWDYTAQAINNMDLRYKCAP